MLAKFVRKYVHSFELFIVTLSFVTIVFPKRRTRLQHENIHFIFIFLFHLAKTRYLSYRTHFDAILFNGKSNICRCRTRHVFRMYFGRSCANRSDCHRGGTIHFRTYLDTNALNTIRIKKQTTDGFIIQKKKRFWRKRIGGIS